MVHGSIRLAPKCHVALIDLATPMPYASRGGYKLAGALDQRSGFL